MAIHFNGVGGGHYSISGSRHPQDATWTVMLRVRFTSLTLNDTAQRLVWINTTADLADAYAVGIVAGNLLSAGYTIGGVQVDDLFTYPIETDRNYHIAVVFEAGVSSRVYIDGQLVHTGTAQSFVPEDLALGGANFGGDWQMHGAFACVRYYTVALTQAQIQAEMAAVEPASTVNLWDSWRFDYYDATGYPGDVNTNTFNNQEGTQDSLVSPATDLPISVANSYSYTAQGGFTLGGAASVSRSRAAVASGGLALSGAAAALRARAIEGAGGITLGGSAAFAKGQTVVAAGGLSMGGTASQIRVRAPAVSGGIALSGAASIETSGSQQFAYAAQGGLQLGGTALQARAGVRAASGGLALRGAAAVSFHEQRRVVVASGGLSLGGSATYRSLIAGSNLIAYTQRTSLGVGVGVSTSRRS